MDINFKIIMLLDNESNTEVKIYNRVVHQGEACIAVSYDKQYIGVI